MGKFSVALIAEIEADTLEDAKKIVYETIDKDFQNGIEYILADDSRTAKSGERIVILPPANKPEEV